MPTTHFRVALIGYGYAGKTFHAPLINTTPGLTLVAVGSSQQASVQADLGDAIDVSADYQAVIQRADIDLVVIASPNDSHAPLAELALQAGKHVVVDKPFALSLEQAQQLTALAQQKQLLLSVFHNRRFDADFIALQQLLASNTLGGIAHLESRFDRFRPEVRQRWREQAGPGAGLWFDLGPHLLDQALLLFGLPKQLQATLKQLRPGATTDDWFSVYLDYGHFGVTLGASMLSAMPSPRFTLQCLQGSWQKFGLDVQEDQLKQGLTPLSDGWGQDPRPAVLYRSDNATEMLLAPGCYQQYYSAIATALRGEGPNPVPAEQACDVMYLLQLAEQSAASGKACLVAAANRV